MTTHITKTWFDGEKVVTKEIPESEVYKQEPVAWADMDVRGEDKGLSWTPGRFHTQPLYTAPRQWVGLTDEERHSIQEWKKIQEELGPVWAPMMLYLYLAIEAKLKEKNDVLRPV